MMEPMKATELRLDHMNPIITNTNFMTKGILIIKIEAEMLIGKMQ